jgi:hypothetical protein
VELLPEAVRALRPIERMMYQALEALAVDGVAAPSVAELGRACLGASPATVRRCLARLRELALIEVREQTAEAHGGRLPNAYRLPLARPAPPPAITPRPSLPTPPPKHPAPSSAPPAPAGPSPFPAPPGSGFLFPDLAQAPASVPMGRPRTGQRYVAACPGFEAFYAAWPRKVARQEAEKAWDQTVEDRPQLAELVAAASRYAAEVQGREPDKILHPATWLRAHRWNDEPQKNGARSARGGAARRPPDGLDDDRRSALARVGRVVDIHEEEP